jgi:pre-mRNA-splicing factor 18
MSPSSSISVEDNTQEIPRVEVVKRLRRRGAPILLFGESHMDAQKRLRKMEIDQPELKEGWKNDFQSAMNRVDEELVEEVIKGARKDQVGKLNVVTPEMACDKTWEQITVEAYQLEKDVDPARDCDIILSFIVHILKRWGDQLNDRDEEIKRSPVGKLDAGTHRQTVDNLKPLMKTLKTHSCNNDIRGHLCHIVKLCVIERDFIQANNAYMEMAIGNSPWPVGVTRSGIHQRPGSAKAYVSNIAHVLNDETQRKYIHGLKRVITKCQGYYATDPSRCVEYVKGPAIK